MDNRWKKAGLIGLGALLGILLSLNFSAVAQRETKLPIPYEDLREEINLFCDLFARPAVQAGLKKFVESKDAQPYLP